MAFVVDKNISINAGAITTIAFGDGVTGFLYGDALYHYYLKEFLKNKLGATVTITSTRTSGTGVDANNAADSDQWNDPQHVAYGYGYWAVRLPASRGITRRLIFQRGPNSTGYTARIKIAYGGDYNVAGGGTATVVPTVSGEEIILGGGTDASPTFGNFLPSGGSYIFHALGYTDSPLCFASVKYPVAGSASGGIGGFFALDALEDGSYEAGCDDSVALHGEASTPSLAQLTSESGFCAARARLGLSGQAWAGVKMLSVGSIPEGAAAEPRTNKKPTARVRYARDGAPADSFGLSRLFRWFGPASSVPRTANRNSTKDKLIIGPIAMPWDGTEPA